VRAKPLAPAWHLGGLLFAAAVALAPRVLGAASDSGELSFARTASLAAAGLVLFFVWHAGRVTVVVTGGALTIGYRLLRSRVPLAEIVSVSAEKLRYFDARAALRRGFAFPYVVGAGDALLVRRRRGLALLVSSDDPPGLFAALAAHGVPAEKLLPDGETSGRTPEPDGA
jgi:hypothetical protein